MTTFSLIAFTAMHGLVYGMLVFLVASGLTLVFGLLNILNLAHAAFYMLGAYIAFSVVQYTGSIWMALLVAPLVVGLFGALIEGTLMRRVSKYGHAYELLLTFGLFFMISEGVLLIWGNYTYQVPAPEILRGAIPFFGGRYPVYRLFVFGVALAICIAMLFGLYRTRIGMIIKSTVSDAPMVAALGINTTLIRLGVFACGSALAAFAGVIAVPFLQVDPMMGNNILIDSFVVIVIGGFGSLPGALIAALLIGLMQAFGVLLVPDLAMMFQLGLMALVLMVRPRGLFGEAR